MTSDAKIGLLLGLIFIFVIAFIINGLPRFRSVANSSELTTNMVSAPNGTLGIGANERRVQDGFDRPAPAPEQPRAGIQRPFEQKEDIRFRMELPRETPAMTESPILKIADQAEPVATPSPASTAPAALADKNTEPARPDTAKPAWPKVYVVTDGDRLADIAKKVYGPEEGNKQANVMRIFQANRPLLKTPDEIYIGQKLTIPPLDASGSEADKSDSVLSGSMFEKVVSIGRKHLLPDPAPRGVTGSTASTGSGSSSTAGPPKVPTRQSAAPAKPPAEYIVREGDYLWRIAAQQLGDGNRYTEIAKLNADQLKDPDSLTVGMRLKMPAR